MVMGKSCHRIRRAHGWRTTNLRSQNMANRLEKVVQIVGGGGGGGGGGFGDVPGSEPPGTGLPPQGTRCYEDMRAKIAQLWPYYVITYVKTDSGDEYFRVSDIGGLYVWKVTGTCQNGYIKINYTLIKSPA
eukprot:gene18340-23424_t